MKISKRKNSLVEFPDNLVENFIKQMKECNEYKEYYLFYKELYGEMYKPNFIDIDTFIKNYEDIRYCEAIINEEGLIEYARPSHDTAIMLAYDFKNEDEYNLACYNLVEYTGYIKVYYGYLCTPSCINSKQYNSIIKLIESDCISENCYEFVRYKKIMD